MRDRPCQTRSLTSRTYRHLSPTHRKLRSHPARRPVLQHRSAVGRRLRSPAARRPVLLTSPRFPSAGLKQIDSSMHRLLAKRTSQRIQFITAHRELRGHPPPRQHARRSCGEAWTSHLGATLLRHPPLLRSLPPRSSLGCLPCRTLPIPRRRRRSERETHSSCSRLPITTSRPLQCPLLLHYWRPLRGPSSSSSRTRKPAGYARAKRTRHAA